jgi:hypothetical protein
MLTDGMVRSRRGARTTDFEKGFPIHIPKGMMFDDPRIMMINARLCM